MLAKIQGVFRLTRDLELKFLSDGAQVAKLGLACSEKYKDKETQLFLEASVFGKVAELLSTYAGTKGTQIFLTGKLKTEQWEANGQKHSKVVMMIEDFQFLGSNQSNNGQTNQAPQQGGYNGNQYQAPQSNQTNHTAYREPPKQMPDRNAIPEIDIYESDVPF
ncbi:MAG: single-stranded DNA-binding protein [Gammaproteobacteria bacterium]|nr:single-stranded DNA-binding protein [Gammaproteobacteria bacterium]